MTQPKRTRAIPIHCPGINASVYFLTLFGIIENVFQAAHIYAECAGSGKYRMSEAFSLICCMWRNMPKHATLNHPLTLPEKKKKVAHTCMQVHTHTHVLELLRGRYSTPWAEERILIDAVSPGPCQARYLGCVCEC